VPSGLPLPSSRINLAAADIAPAALFDCEDFSKLRAIAIMQNIFINYFKKIKIYIA